jgi:hypothetical protein
LNSFSQTYGENDQTSTFRSIVGRGGYAHRSHCFAGVREGVRDFLREVIAKGSWTFFRSSFGLKASRSKSSAQRESDVFETVGLRPSIISDFESWRFQLRISCSWSSSQKLHRHRPDKIPIESLKSSPRLFAIERKSFVKKFHRALDSRTSLEMVDSCCEHRGCMTGSDQPQSCITGRRLSPEAWLPRRRQRDSCDE